MKRLLLSILTITMIGSLSAQRNTSVEQYVEVDGVSQIEIEPNRFELNITIDEATTKGRVSVASLEQQMISQLKEIGVESERDLRINDIASETIARKESRSRANYTLSLDSPKRLLAAVERLSSLEITNVALSKVTHSEIEEYISQARREAILDAQRRARELAEPLGQSIGACFQIFDCTNHYPHNSPQLMRAQFAGEGAQLEISRFEPITVRYLVTARFHLSK